MSKDENIQQKNSWYKRYKTKQQFVLGGIIIAIIAVNAISFYRQLKK